MAASRTHRDHNPEIVGSHFLCWEELATICPPSPAEETPPSTPLGSF